MLILGLYILAWWILAFLKFFDIFIVNWDCFLHILYDLPLDIIQNLFLHAPVFVKFGLLIMSVFFGGTAGFPYLAGLIAIILAVYIIDYSASVLYPKAHRKWCKRRKECNYRYVSKKINRMFCNISLFECKKEKPEKCKKEKNIMDILTEMFPFGSSLFGSLFKDTTPEDNKENRFPYVFGFKEPEYRKELKL
tara:strand:+ start:169 stop:747 length:579 start_codon:yes stop_codon:yes gene_type:complete